MKKNLKINYVLGSKIYSFYLYLVLFSLCFSPLRTFGIYNVQALDNLLVPLVITVLILIWLVKLKQKIYLDNFSLILVLMFFQGLIVGIFRDNSVYYLLSDLFTILAALITYNVSSLLYIDIYSLLATIKKFSKLIVCLSGLIISIDYVITYFFNGFSYLSYGDYLTLISFSYFLFYRNKKFLLFTIFILFFGAKVGAMLAAAGIYFIYLITIKANKISPGVLVILSMFLLSFSMLTMYLIRDYQPYGNSLFSNVITKIQGYNYFHFDQYNSDIDDYGAGRMIEIKNSFRAFSSLSGMPYIFGAGAGFIYEKNRFGIENHNVHLSIVNIFEKHGLVLTILFYLGWLNSLYKSYKTTLDIKEPNTKKIVGVMCCFCFGVFIFSFTAFSIFVVLSSWFFLGFINSIIRQQPNIRRLDCVA